MSIFHSKQKSFRLGGTLLLNYKTFLVVVFFSLTATIIVHAEDTPVAAAPAATAAYVVPNKLTASLSTSYYELHGHKADDRKYYDFEKLNARIDLHNLNYGAQGGWSINLLLQHYDFYTETIFPQAALPQWYRSNDRTIGAGDTYLSVVTPTHFVNGWMLTPTFGVSIPTGGINYKSHLPGLEQSNLAYNAQHGSGTYDVLLGGSALLLIDNGVIIFGNNLLLDIRTGRNTNSYRLGNMYKYDNWLEYNTAYGITPKLVGSYRYKAAIDGFDKSRGYVLSGVQYENASDEFYHHAQKDWSVSAAVKYSKMFTDSNLTVSGEAGIPVIQRNENWDNSEVIAKYYVNLSLLGQF